MIVSVSGPLNLTISLRLYNNRAACHMLLKQYNESIQDATMVRELPPLMLLMADASSSDSQIIRNNRNIGHGSLVCRRLILPIPYLSSLEKGSSFC